jgi:UDP-N-acetylmuramyl pentapeptide phosphotransferase/UDP-N-acetylglucosamine-1-phosphate transferase
MALAITLPLVGDTLLTLFRRLLSRENIYKAGHSSLYQRLQQAGWFHRQVTVLCLVLTLLVEWNISFLGEWGIR